MKHRVLEKSSKNLAEENKKTAPLPRDLGSPPLEENSYLHFFAKLRRKPSLGGRPNYIHYWIQSNHSRGCSNVALLREYGKLH